jgi:hypothetical protein
MREGRALGTGRHAVHVAMLDLDEMLAVFAEVGGERPPVQPIAVTR